MTGVGGLFFRAKDPKALAEWYRTHLGVGAPEGEAAWATEAGDTVFAPFPEGSDYFRADKPFMLNLRVEGIDALIERLEAAGVTVKRLADETYGTFAHLEDPEGTPIELWQPKAG